MTRISRVSTFAALICTLAMLVPSAAVAYVGYIPAPTADSPAKAIVRKKLLKLGKEKFKEEREMAAEKDNPCQEIDFQAEVLYDSSSFFSLIITDSFTCIGRTAQGILRPLLYDMQTGLEYDISKLYRIRDLNGMLTLPAVQLMAKSILRSEPNKSLEDIITDIYFLTTPDHAPNNPSLYVTPHGLRFTGDGLAEGYSDALITWDELSPYLDLAEAERLKWPYR